MVELPTVDTVRVFTTSELFFTIFNTVLLNADHVFCQITSIIVLCLCPIVSIKSYGDMYCYMYVVAVSHWTGRWTSYIHQKPFLFYCICMYVCVWVASHIALWILSQSWGLFLTFIKSGYFWNTKNCSKPGARSCIDMAHRLLAYYHASSPHRVSNFLLGKEILLLLLNAPESCLFMLLVLLVGWFI